MDISTPKTPVSKVEKRKSPPELKRTAKRMRIESPQILESHMDISTPKTPKSKVEKRKSPDDKSLDYMEISTPKLNSPTYNTFEASNIPVRKLTSPVSKRTRSAKINFGPIAKRTRSKNFKTRQSLAKYRQSLAKYR